MPKPWPRALWARLLCKNRQPSIQHMGREQLGRGREAQYPPHKGGSRSPGRRESRKRCLTASGREGNTTKAGQHKGALPQWPPPGRVRPPAGEGGRNSGLAPHLSSRPGSEAQRPPQHGFCSQVAWSGPCLFCVTLNEGHTHSVLQFSYL